MIDFTDVLNTKFNKSDIYTASLCETNISEGKFSITYKKEVVGAYNGVLFIDFISGKLYNVIEINKEAKLKPFEEYVVSPKKLYDKPGKIRPIEVLCDFESNVEDKNCVRKR